MQWIRNNSLSLCFFLLFLFAMGGQIGTGWYTYNEHQVSEGSEPVALGAYLQSGHFLQSTFENWESEFLQMALYVVLTIFLYQKGSSESKDPDKQQEEVDREPDPKRKGAPGPVRSGGWILALYKHSLSIALLLLFLLSFAAHYYGSWMDYNEEQAAKGDATVALMDYGGHPRFWFESFQNWQSEFLSVFVIVVFSVFLRQKGSPQSKPVDTPYSETEG